MSEAISSKLHTLVNVDDADQANTAQVQAYATSLKSKDTPQADLVDAIWLVCLQVEANESAEEAHLSSPYHLLALFLKYCVDISLVSTDMALERIDLDLVEHAPARLRGQSPAQTDAQDQHAQPVQATEVQLVERGK